MILVTGATGTTGTTGGALMRRLSGANIPARALVRDPARAGSLQALPGVSLALGDLDRPAGLAGAFEDVDRAYLVTNSTERAQERQLGFIEAAKRAGVRYVVKLSQLGAASNSPVRFLRYHAAVERALRDSGLAWTMLRPNLFMHGMLLLVASARSEGRIYSPAGDAGISMVDVSDIAEAAFHALTGTRHEGRTYDLTGPEALTFDDVARTPTQVMGRRITYVDVPGSALGEMLASVGTPAWQVEGAMEDFEHYRRCEAAAVSDGLLSATGRDGTRFEAFARSTVAAFTPSPD